MTFFYNLQKDALFNIIQLIWKIAKQISPSGTVNSARDISRRFASRYISTPIHLPFEVKLYYFKMYAINSLRRWRSLRSWRYCVLVEWDLAGEPLYQSSENASSPLPFLDRGSAAKTLITQYRQLRRLSLARRLKSDALQTFYPSCHVSDEFNSFYTSHNRRILLHGRL